MENDQVYVDVTFFECGISVINVGKLLNATFSKGLINCFEIRDVDALKKKT